MQMRPVQNSTSCVRSRSAKTGMTAVWRDIAKGTERPRIESPRSPSAGANLPVGPISTQSSTGRIRRCAVNGRGVRGATDCPPRTYIRPMATQAQRRTSRSIGSAEKTLSTSPRRTRPTAAAVAALGEARATTSSRGCPDRRRAAWHQPRSAGTPSAASTRSREGDVPQASASHRCEANSRRRRSASGAGTSLT